MKKMTSAIKKQDWILILILLILSLIFGIGYALSHRTPAIRAEVTIDGTVVQVLDLAKDQEITIEGKRNQTNHLIVSNGEIWCDQASCPDQICIHQGKQSRDGDIIVCLPNLMIVQIIGEE